MTELADKIPIYRNAIEPLVAEELEQQLQRVPKQILQYINPAQVMAYALNRLPALYATSEEGWHRQQLRAKQQLLEQIATAVRQGLAAVQKDPLKTSTPLKGEATVQQKDILRNSIHRQQWASYVQKSAYKSGYLRL
ncbi:MAG TPA: hypothetical protein DCY88_08600 [Cyanobacteria bacterium UBA11372]|nr:hypothetical protein [Cyanobacteria bacterium UBA11372]